MNNPLIAPPVAMRFTPLTPYVAAMAKRGLCPHCPSVRFSDGSEYKPASMQAKYTCDAITFLQCSKCLVVVALEKGS